MVECWSAKSKSTHYAEENISEYKISYYRIMNIDVLMCLSLEY